MGTAPARPTQPGPKLPAAGTGEERRPPLLDADGEAVALQGAARPRTTCLVNCFNYARYVEEALASAFAQRVPFDEVIVVDDGSTDDSRAVIERFLAALPPGAPEGRLVSKPNGGQLSSFHAGLAAATGELVFFLDADDAYEPEYLERALAVYAERPEVEFLIVALTKFGALEAVEVDKRGTRDLGYSLVRALGHRAWVGGPTSTLSMRRAVLDSFLPLPDDFLGDWRISADDCLIYGASVAGARKYYLGEPLMRYRQHATNAHLGRGYCPYRDFEKKMAVARLIQHLARRFDRSLELVGFATHREFCTIERPSYKEMRKYLRIVSRVPAPFGKRLGMRLAILRHFLAERRATKRGRASSSGARAGAPRA